MSYEMQLPRPVEPASTTNVAVSKEWTPDELFLLAMGCPECAEPTAFQQVFLRFIRFRMQPVLKDLEPLLFDDSSNKSVPLMDRGFRLLTYIARECVQQSNFDINSVIRAATTAQLPTPLLRPAVLDDPGLLEAAQTLCFYLVGCILMLYPPTVPERPPARLTLITGRSNAERNSLPTTDCDTALTELIHRFGSLMPTKPRGLYAADSAAVAFESPDANFSRQSLYVSLLNATTLREVGGVNFVWTDCIGSHLHFDEETLTVLLFRLPSFCMMLRASESDAFSRILEGYYDEYSIPDQFSASGYLAEICRSYALLFDNTTNSRREYTRHQRRNAFIGHNSSVERTQSSVEPVAEDDFNIEKRKLLSIVYTKPTKGQADDFIDPFLDRLCRGARPKPRNSYSKLISFPILNQRLSILQDYILRQNAMSVKMLWRDRRNKLQWSTFWAVVILGSFGIVLQLLQTVLTGVQVYYAKYPKAI